MAVYAIEVSASLLGQNRYNVDTTAPAGEHFASGAVCIPQRGRSVRSDGSLSLVRPFGLVTMFDETFQNLTGIPIYDWPTSRIVIDQHHARRGRPYIDRCDRRRSDRQSLDDEYGSPMQQLPPGSTWKAWCSIAGTIPQVWVRTSTIYILDAEAGADETTINLWSNRTVPCRHLDNSRTVRRRLNRATEGWSRVLQSFCCGRIESTLRRRQVPDLGLAACPCSA